MRFLGFVMCINVLLLFKWLFTVGNPVMELLCAVAIVLEVWTMVDCHRIKEDA